MYPEQLAQPKLAPGLQSAGALLLDFVEAEAYLGEVFSGWRITEIIRPVSRPTQTKLFGNGSSQMGEIDLISVDDITTDFPTEVADLRGKGLSREWGE